MKRNSSDNSNSKSTSLGVRKGAWIAEEDFLLRKCIEKYGEGKWHQVPAKAGLNRCRKSCRLRWLNYLRPDIKRGCFTQDEEDLIIRLHKLLGNRWSLIAGRIPGRTANDVKNYWNSHLQKKVILPREYKRVPEPHKMTTIIKPQPRTFSKKQPPGLEGKSVTRSTVESIQLLELDNCNKSLISTVPTSPAANDDSIKEWWANLFVEHENNGSETSETAVGPMSFNVTEEKEGFDMSGLWTDEVTPTNEAGPSIFVEDDGQKGWNGDFCVWDLLS